MRRNKCIPNTKPRIEETLKTCDKTRVKVANKEQTEEGNYRRKGEQQDSKEYYHSKKCTNDLPTHPPMKKMFFRTLWM